MHYHSIVHWASSVDAEYMDREAEKRRQALTRFMELHKLKRGSLARRAKISPNIIYNFFKGKSGYLSQPTLEQIAKAFNVPISDITGENIIKQRRALVDGMGETTGSFTDGADQGVALPEELATLKISGAILSAAVWSETIFLDPEKEEFVSFNMPSLYRDKVFAVRLVGPSMDMLLPSNAVLGCIAIRDYLQQIRSGDIVVMVRRNAEGLFQTTAKQYILDGTAMHYLVARSSDQRYAERAELNSPIDDPAALGTQDFFIHAVVLAYAADLPALRR